MVFSTKASKIAADTISSFLNVKSVLILLFAFSLFSFAQAASITSINESFLCQCDTIKQSFSVCADAGGAYSLKAEGQNSNWITFAPSNFNLDAGECMNVYLFSTPSCYSHSGDYNYSIVLSGQESAKTNYKISVIQCHTIGFSAVESSASVNPCDSVYYNFSITNTGKFSDEFVLRQNGLPNDWVSYSREKFVLNPGQSLNSMLKVSPVCSADANIYNFSISAMNTMTNASSSVDLSLQVENYIPFELLDLFNSAGNTFSQKSCEEFDKNIVLNLKNVSNRADTYTIDLLDLNQNIAGKDIGYFGQNTVLVPAGGNIDLNLVIAKHIAGTKQGFLRVHSKEYSKDYTVPFEFVFENCYDFSITRVNPVNKACLNKRLEEFDIANTGSEPLDLNFALFVDNNITESKSLSLGVMESEHVSFQVNPIRAQKSSHSIFYVPIHEQRPLEMLVVKLIDLG
ncbi:MAG: hypothetical protein NTY48_01695 [Candidatus Diapherotrites archaeon]|nr:hypothetical protein [Candidatus Diapherotrites archaeon]